LVHGPAPEEWTWQCCVWVLRGLARGGEEGGGGGTCYVAMHLGKAAVQRCGSPGVVRRCGRVDGGWRKTWYSSEEVKMW